MFRSSVLTLHSWWRCTRQHVSTLVVRQQASTLQAGGHTFLHALQLGLPPKLVSGARACPCASPCAYPCVCPCLHVRGGARACMSVCWCVGVLVCWCVRASACRGFRAFLCIPHVLIHQRPDSRVERKLADEGDEEFDLRHHARPHLTAVGFVKVGNNPRVANERPRGYTDTQGEM